MLALNERPFSLRQPGVTLKDLDFLEKAQLLSVRCDRYEEFMNVVRKDALFFEENNLIDYSMLVGVHYEKDC